MTLKSIVPSRMTQTELRYVISRLFTARNWGSDHIKVTLTNGCDYRIDVKDINDYREYHEVQTGAIPRGVGI